VGNLRNENHLTINPIFKNRQFKVDNKYIFVLMPFVEHWSSDVWSVIEYYLNSAKYKCKRADNLYGHNVIEDIWTGINESNIIIADITSKNPNVFYEIGIAHTLGKRVIIITQDRGALPFDFRVYRVIFYENSESGLRNLTYELKNFIDQ